MNALRTLIESCRFGAVIVVNAIALGLEDHPSFPTLHRLRSVRRLGNDPAASSGRGRVGGDETKVTGFL